MMPAPLAQAGANPLAIYLHWPYCARICPYCDFNVYKMGGGAGDKAGRDKGDALCAAMLEDLTHWRGWSGPREVSSVHFGGGTPSLMRPAQIGAVLERCAQLWDIAPGAELALEANPIDADEDKWAALRALGINRLSLGVQSFDDPALKFLGRDHDASQARAALDLAVKIFPRVSLDLIFGLAGQSLKQFERDLDQAIASGAGHISAYQLTIEAGTAFERAERRGLLRAVDNDASADFYALAKARLSAAGFEHYEVSNYAKPGQQSAHNRAYWEGRDYVGVGPGAHGRLSHPHLGTTVSPAAQGHGHSGAKRRFATETHLTPGAYIKAVGATGSGQSVTEVLSPAEHGSEYVLMGLRLSDGISLSRYAHITGKALFPESLIKQGLLVRRADRLIATDEGRVRLNAVTLALLSEDAKAP